MKFSAINTATLAVCPLVAAEMLGLSLDTFQAALVNRGWIALSVNEHKLVLYDVEHVRGVWERIKREGWPG